SMGAASNPLWLALNIAAGGVVLNGGASLYAIVRAPSGSVVLNGNTLLQGSVVCDRLILNGNSTLKGTPGVLDTISLTRATQGQTLSVSLHGLNTHWVQGQTKASFGGEVSVGGAPTGDFGPVQIVDSTTATAQLAVSATAALAPRTVKVVTEIVVPFDVATETLVDGFTIASASSPGAPSATVTTVAGSAGTPGFADGAASQALFRDLASIASAPDDTIYVADAGNNRIRKIAIDGAVTTVAGDGNAGFADGPGASAQFNNPQGVAVDSSGGVYVADTGNHRLRRIATDGTVSTMAGSGTAGLQDGAGAQARFNSPRGLAFDNGGNIYVADTGNSAVRFISAGGNVSTVAGDGTIGSSDSPAARFNGLIGIVFNGGSLYAYLADTNNHKIRRLDSAGNVLTIGGADRGFADEAPGLARFADPSGIAIEATGKLIIADATNSLVRLVDPGTAPVSTIAGAGERGIADGSGSVARFFTPRGVAVERSSAILIADTGNHTVRRITLPPSIASINPSRSRTGEIVVIHGERFDGRAPSRNTVRFTRAGGGQTAAQVLAAGSISLSVIVPQDAATGPVTVQTDGGTATSAANLEIIPQPVIADFNPKSGQIGTTVTITGAGLKSAQGDTVVTFAGPGARLQALVSFASPIEVRAAVPEGALTGPINVQTEGGTAASATNFQVVVTAPVISDFDPKSGQVGSSVTLTGASLMAGTLAPSVTFAGSGGTRLTALVTSASPSSVRATVPNAAVTGTIQLTTAGGTASTPGPFTVQTSQRDYQLTIAPSSSSQAGTILYSYNGAGQRTSMTTGGRKR
ncbi:MAG: IPT/TIG domain-containing protein, partial [Blastocatellia bacterium]